jgi:hypothetical protein
MPMVGAKEPKIGEMISWQAAADSTPAAMNCRKRLPPHSRSSSLPNIHRPSMLKKMWPMSACRKA